MTRIPRLLIPSERWPQAEGTLLELDSQEQHYLAHVLRLQVGNLVSIFDGKGKACIAPIGSQSTGRFFLKLGSIQGDSEPVSDLNAEIILIQGLLKHDKFDWVVEKATELGVRRIIPMQSERSNVSIDAHRIESRYARWKRIAQSAAEQCGRNDLPEIEPMRGFPQIVERKDLGTKILCWEKEESSRTLGNVLGKGRLGRIALLIGPEGGFSTQEAQIATHHGCLLVTLGSRILRAETAAIAALAIVGFLEQENSQ